MVGPVSSQRAESAGLGHESIFVSIASYRDNQCQYTIADLFKKAKHPERVVVGVCFQVAKDDDDSFLLDLSEWSGNIRTYFLHHTDAQGPCYARALIQQELFRDEDYFFQIDSHLRFAQDWDILCLEQLKCCDSPKPLLTSYASSYSLPKGYQPGGPDTAILSTSKTVSIICADSFGDQNQDDPFLRIKTRSCRSDLGGIPPPALFWTARFSFSPGRAVREAPYDPHLEYIFFGEEVAMSARLWTSGWDFFNPTEVIAYHLASRSHRHWFREVQTSQHQLQRETQAKGRICGLLGVRWPQGERHAAPPKPYGLGDARTLQEYEKFAGVCFSTQEIRERGRHGGLSAELFAPQWAEEERERIMHAAQMTDVASWAGKGNVGALQRQFPDRAAEVAATELRPHSSHPEAHRLRELMRISIQGLQSQLQDSSEGAEQLELELSRRFAALAQGEALDHQAQRAGEAYAQALKHAEAALERAEDERRNDPLWRGALENAACVALLGLRRFVDAKRRLKGALQFAIDALALQRDDDAEQLVSDVVDAIHRAHEQTDDRKGLEGFVPKLQTLLVKLQLLTGEQEQAVPLIAASERPPDMGEVGLRARLLERLVLMCIATGREEHAEVARSVFRRFRVARESPNLRRMLGMLQSSGTFIDP